MGIVSSLLSQSKMKFLLVLAVAAYAKAEAEADPGFVYSVGAHLPLTYTYAAAHPLVYTHHTPLVYTVPAAGCQNSEGAVVPCAHGVLPFVAAPVAPAAEAADAAPAVEAERKKREAEAEPEAAADPEADPWLYYSRLYSHGYHYAPLTYSYAPYTYSHVYNHYGLRHLGYYGKRSADAEPEAEAKPEADPEADPWLYYSGLYGHGYHYAPLAYSYAPYTYSHVYNHYGLRHLGYYGKREAEAEPEATADPEADPWLYYSSGVYGHHGYHYAPFTYAAYHHPLTYFVGGCRNNQGALVPCAGK